MGNQLQRWSQLGRGRKWLIWIVVIAVVLVGLDFGAKVAAGPSEIELQLVSSSGLPSGLASAAQTITLPVKSLPLGLQMTGGLNSSSNGIDVNVKADSVSFGS